MPQDGLSLKEDLTQKRKDAKKKATDRKKISDYMPSIRVSSVFHPWLRSFSFLRAFAPLRDTSFQGVVFLP